MIHRTLSKKDYKHGVFPGQQFLQLQITSDTLTYKCACVSAAVAWSLHRDLGFPLDLVDLMLEERGVRVDHQELNILITENNKVFSPWHPGAFREAISLTFKGVRSKNIFYIRL